MRKRLGVEGVVILAVLAVVLFVAQYLTRGITVNPDNYANIDSGWDMNINDRSIRNVNLQEDSFPMVNKGDVVTISNKMPIKRISNPELEIFSIHSTLEVWLDGELIYEYGKDMYSQGKMLGYGYHRIDFPDDYMGKKLNIRMQISENQAFTTLDVPRVCNSKYSLRDYLYENRMPLVLDIFLIMFGVCAGVTTGFGLIKEKKLFKLFCTSMISLLVGMWSFANYNLTFIFTDNLLVKAVFEFACLYILPVFVLLYFSNESMLKGTLIRKSCYCTLFALQILFDIVTFGGQLMGIIHFPQMLRLQHVLMLAEMIYVFAIFIVDIVKKQMKSIILFEGVIVMAIFVLLDVLRFYLEKYIPVFAKGEYRGSVGIGAVILVVSLIINYINEVMDAYYNTAQQDALKQMAYTDTLTGLANRRKCEEVFDELDSLDVDYEVIEFDLNNLKKVNDTLGHEVGDIYIKTFGIALRNVFAPYGLVSRTGGDEFVVAIKDVTQIDVEQLLEQLNLSLAKINEEHPGWNMSTAYGKSRYSEDKLPSIRKAYKKADERMYDHKQWMKQMGVAGIR